VRVEARDEVAEALVVLRARPVDPARVDRPLEPSTRSAARSKVRTGSARSYPSDRRESGTPIDVHPADFSRPGELRRRAAANARAVLEEPSADILALVGGATRRRLMDCRSPA
jgi:hypothetical protein